LPSQGTVEWDKSVVTGVDFTGLAKGVADTERAWRMRYFRNRSSHGLGEPQKLLCIDEALEKATSSGQAIFMPWRF